MKSYQNLFTCCLHLSLLLICISAHAQETNGDVSGRVLLNSGDVPSAATVTVIHEPTQSKYVSLTRVDGYFHFFDLKPGGPYSIVISYVGHLSFEQTDYFVSLNSTHFVTAGKIEISDFKLLKKNDTLQQVFVSHHNLNGLKTGIETSISASTIQSLPSIGHGLQDYIRLVPQAKVTGEGGISLAGQNNRSNAFFIDGANSNDLIGLAPNGTNGGQTGSPPISMEAIDEIKISLAPYDAQFGNFTGGSINAITRSGGNDTKAAAWYSFRNENLAGRSPAPVRKSDSSGFSRPRLSSFFNQTSGLWSSGAIIKNKLFYFTLFERQSDNNPRPFNINDYQGNSKQTQLNKLSDYLKTQYNYDPGSFVETKDELTAARFMLKLDWNASVTDKLMLSYRYNYAERTAPRFQNSSTAVYAKNNGFVLPAITHSSSFEWKHFFRKDMSNRLLLTFTNEAEDRRWVGAPFPRITIADGGGSSIVVGSDAQSALNNYAAQDITIFDAFKFIKGRNVFTAGVDLNYNHQNDALILSYFGDYQYKNLNDFLSGAAPSRYQDSYSLLDVPRGDNTAAAMKFGTMRLSSFVNDEIRLAANLRLNLGLRIDRNSMPASSPGDQFFNDTAMNILSKYYNLQGAKAGRVMNAQWLTSPRLGLDFKLPKQNLTIRSGAGIFAAHIPYPWVYYVYFRGIANLDINPQRLTGLHFVPDPYNQPTPQSSNLDASFSKRDNYLIAPNFKYPSILRTSLAIDKLLKNNWTISLEGILTKNLNEAAFSNVNIHPPIGMSSNPGSRNVYATVTGSPGAIPLKADGTNPYSSVFLLSNNNEKRGAAYSVSVIVDKQLSNFSFHSSYTYARSRVLFEMTDNSNTIAPQWHTTETVNGKNFTGLSTSDNDMQHRITGYILKKINYLHNKAGTIITLFYNAQSGAPYSYVYGGSIINDFSAIDRYDLIYVPTSHDLSAMVFTEYKASDGTVFTSQSQKDLLNSFITNDKYLSKHRGKFAERNAARLPFTNIIDLRLQEDLVIKVKGKNIRYSIIYDVFNFTNMLNKNWGRIYFLSMDNYQLIQLDKSNTDALNPHYQFIPPKGSIYSLQTSTIPGNSPRWTSQLGIKINFN